MIFSCVVPFKRKKKKIPDLSLPPCISAFYPYVYCIFEVQVKELVLVNFMWISVFYTGAFSMCEVQLSSKGIRPCWFLCKWSIFNLFFFTANAHWSFSDLRVPVRLSCHVKKYLRNILDFTWWVDVGWAACQWRSSTPTSTPPTSWTVSRIFCSFRYRCRSYTSRGCVDLNPEL